jgi:LysR family transcriptional activator of nhaA
MEWTNYNHLFYFWTVARLGSVSKASTELEVSQPTISEQLRRLEESLAVKLFERAGRGLRLTSSGRTAFRYAEEIFRAGRELREALSMPSKAVSRLAVGVTRFVPALVTHRLLAPALGKSTDVRLLCVEDDIEPLLAQLATHQLDLVLSDAPLPSTMKLRAFSHRIKRCGVTFVASSGLLHAGRFPQLLNGAPLLMPRSNSSLSNALEKWFARHNVHPQVVGEFSGSAQLETFGAAGAGIFAIPSLVEREVCARCSVAVLGRTKEIVREFYAFTAERHGSTPHIAAIFRDTAPSGRTR